MRPSSACYVYILIAVFWKMFEYFFGQPEKQAQQAQGAAGGGGRELEAEKARPLLVDSSGAVHADEDDEQEDVACKKSK
eukprot:tig00001239_g7755.t1